MTEKMHARITLRTTGMAPAVAANVGVLSQMVNQVEVEALPDDLPQSIDLDISALKNVDDTVYARDLKVSSLVTLDGDLDEPIIKIVQTRAGRWRSSSRRSPAKPCQFAGLPMGSATARAVVEHVLRGASTSEISRALCISDYTVQEHLSHMSDKVGVRGR